MPDKPKLPGVSNRTIIIGRTGTGKTVAGLWHLSRQDMSMPWVVLNFKNDEHIDSIRNTTEIGFDWTPNKHSRGLHILRPIPPDAKGNPSALEVFLWKIWEHENIGVFCDEMSMIGNNDACDACLTQGRSKRIPFIGCTQRPAWVTRYAFSEASFIQVFDLNDARDIQTVESFIPIEWDEEIPLKAHQSWYYEIDRAKLFRLNPVPAMTTTRRVFEQKLYRPIVRI